MGSNRNDAYNAQQKQRNETYANASTAYKNSQTPTANETGAGQLASGMAGNYNSAVAGDKETYGALMKGFGDYGKNAKFSFQSVKNERPQELGEAYGYLREAMPGYRDFAKTGGYSDTDQQELRARGIAPIRSAYGNTMRELDRSRALGGNGGSSNYIAARSRAQRELPGQMADAMTNVNAGLADAIRQGKLAGLAGISGIGSTMGGFADSDANRSLTAAGMNQNADLQVQGMKDAANRFALSGGSQLYGTTPGQSSMFGNQALSAYNTAGGLENSRNMYGLGSIGAQQNAFNPVNDQKQKPWWQQALGTAANLGGQILGGYAGAPGGRI